MFIWTVSISFCLKFSDVLKRRGHEGEKYEGKNKPEMPFSLFISCERRRRLLDAMMADSETARTKGDMILNNYKKQIAERMAREKVDSYEAAKILPREATGKSVSIS